MWCSLPPRARRCWIFGHRVCRYLRQAGKIRPAAGNTCRRVAGRPSTPARIAANLPCARCTPHGRRGRSTGLCSVRKAKCSSGESPRHATHAQRCFHRCSGLTLPPFARPRRSKCRWTSRYAQIRRREGGNPPRTASFVDGRGVKPIRLDGSVDQSRSRRRGRPVSSIRLASKPRGWPTSSIGGGSKPSSGRIRRSKGGQAFASARFRRWKRVETARTAVFVDQSGRSLQIRTAAPCSILTTSTGERTGTSPTLSPPRSC